jgi:hypothetical protein
MTFVERATAKKIFIWISGPGVVQLRPFFFHSSGDPLLSGIAGYVTGMRTSGCPNLRLLLLCTEVLWRTEWGGILAAELSAFVGCTLSGREDSVAGLVISRYDACLLGLGKFRFPCAVHDLL